MSQYNNEKSILNIFGFLSTRNFIALIILIVLSSILILIHNKAIGFFVVPTSSMEPTLMPGDKLMAVKQEVYYRGDIIALKDPKEDGAFLAKRIVAIGGDSVFIAPIGLSINGTLMREPYLQEAIEYEFGPYTVPEGYIFVLGDNRNKSDDSHLWGQGVPAETIIGKLSYIYSPKERRGALPEGNPAFPANSQ